LFKEDDCKKIPELLTRGHHVNEKRLGLLEERAEYSQYLILPTKYSFPKVVRIMSIVTGFVYKVREGLNKIINKIDGIFYGGLTRSPPSPFGVYLLR
jgi:hypothetical protein